MAAGTTRPRLVVIGLDGADWQIIAPLIDRGALPNIARLMRDGSHGELLSSFPPHTPCAWTTIFTGVNPGKHGIFTFHTVVPGTYTWKLTRSTDRKARALWEIANAAGLRVGAINIPMTFPAERIDGYMISGMIGAPAVVPSAFWPRELQDEALRVAPNLSMDVVARHGGRYSVDELRDKLAGRLALSRRLLRSRPVDVLLAVITATDAVQHHWLTDPSTPLEGAQEVLRETYQRADELIGEITEEVGDEGDIVILSDHGSGPVNLYLNLPRLLEDLGLIKRVSPTREFFLRAQKKLATMLPRKPDHTRGLIRPIACDQVMARSQVYSMLTHVSLRLNLAGREPTGIIPAEHEQMARAEIAAALAEVRTDKAPWARLEMRTRDELFSGEYTHLMPDLCGMTLEGQTLSMPPRRYLRAQPAFLTPREAVALDPDIVRGTHRLQGVLLAAGPSFRTGREVSGATLADITPTLLQVLGLPVPTYMDGRPLAEMLTTGATTTTDDTTAERAGTSMDGYDEDEAALVEKRLRDLGYM